MTDEKDPAREEFENAVARYIMEACDGAIVTDWVLIAANTKMDDIGTGATRYFLGGNTAQPLHTTLGLVAYVHAHGPFQNDTDDTDEDDD